MTNQLVSLGKLLADAELFTDGDWVESKDQDKLGSHRLIQLADIGDGYFLNKSARFMNEAAFNRLRCTELKRGDLLIARMPEPLGRACVFPGDSKICATVVDVCIIRPNENRVNVRWLQHALNSPLVRAQIKSLSRGATRIRISRKDLSAILIPYSPLEEQKRIAAILDKAAEIKVKREQAITKLDELAKSTFVEMFGDFEQAVGHTVKPLSQLIQDTRLGLVRGAKELGEQKKYAYMRMNAITKSGELHLEKMLRSDATDLEVEQYALRKGDFLFNTRNSRELVGKTALFDLEGLYLFNNNIMRIRFNELVNSVYVAECFQTPYVQKKLEQIKSGTTNVFAIYFKDLGKIEIPLPSLANQNLFEEKISTIKKSRKMLKNALSIDDELIQSLQHQAFTTGLSA